MAFRRFKIWLSAEEGEEVEGAEDDVEETGVSFHRIAWEPS